MTDPRKEDRERVQAMQRQPFAVMPTQALERVKQRLSPVDDDLPFAQAVRSHEQIAQAMAIWRSRKKAKR